MEALLSLDQLIAVLRQEAPYLRQEFGVEQIAVFGSYAKGWPRAESDVDILVRLQRPLGLKFVRLARYLEAKVGRKVDLTTFEHFERSLQTARYRHIATDIQRTLAYV